MRIQLLQLSIVLLIAGCANHADYTPSENPMMRTFSPDTAKPTEAGIMQRNLDAWLRDEWKPLTQPESVSTAEKNVVIPDNNNAETGNEEPFTLQKYVDKWKMYHQNKAKAEEGKAKELSGEEKMKLLPVIGK